jgi:hypothetical protein
MDTPDHEPVRIELQDSEVSCIATDGEHLRIDLPVAAVPRRGGSYLTAVALLLESAEVLHRDEGCIGRLAGGELRRDGAALAGLRVPSRHEGRIELRLQFAHGSSFAAVGHTLTLSRADGSHLREHLHC